MKKKQCTKQYKNAEHKKQKATHTRQENKHKTNNKNIKRVITTKQRGKRHKANNNQTTYYTESHVQTT